MLVEELLGLWPGGSRDPFRERLAYLVVVPSTAQDRVKAFRVDLVEDVGEAVDGRALGEENRGQIQAGAEVWLPQPVGVCVEERLGGGPVAGPAP